MMGMQQALRRRMMGSADIGFVPRNGLVLEYTMDSLSGNTVLDTSNNPANGTGQNVTFVPGKIGNAAAFNGSSSLIQIPAKISKLSASSLTICGWFKSLTSDGMKCGIAHDYSAISAGASPANSGWFLSVPAVGARFIYMSGTTGNDGTSIKQVSINIALNDALHFVCASMDTKSTSKIEVVISVDNGTPIKQTFTSAVQYTASGPFNGVGGTIYDSARYYMLSGNIDQLRVYNRVLSAHEISGLYNHGRGI